MNRLQAAGVGANVLSDWLGDGCTPVSTEQAVRRAETCTHGDCGNRCSFNKSGSWWDRIAAGTVQIILAQRRAKNALGLSVKDEHDLAFCDVCHCHLPTKIWVPMEHIERHTPSDVWALLPYWCWMKKEKSNYLKQQKLQILI